MKLLPTNLVQPAGNNLARLIEANGDHLATGYAATDELLNVLSETGHSDLAYKVLTQTTYPSWGYEIAHGATTVWEKWDAIEPNGSYDDQGAGIDSFNHPAEGGAADWMYADLGGIQSEAPGFAKI